MVAPASEAPLATSNQTLSFASTELCRTMAEAFMVGWAHSRFGKLEEPDTEGLMDLVIADAVRDAGVEPAEIDAVFVGQFNSGFSRQDFPSSLPMQSLPQLHGKPSVRCENACASGSAAIFAARDFIASGRGRIALVIGVEKMTHATAAEAGANLLGASYHKEEGAIPAGFAGLFGRVAEAYFQRYGDHSDALAAIAAKNHRNGVDNAYAQMRKDLGYAFCREESDRNPFVAPPLKRTDCSLISDGAAAVVLATEDLACCLPRAVGFRAAVQVNDFLPMSGRDPTWMSGAALAWAKAFDTSGIQLEDLSFAEVHDCFTIAELMIYEAMGLAPPGGGARPMFDGETEPSGRLPINRSGGLKAKGHPIGATGVSMHIIAAMQLCGEAGAMQLPRSELAAVFNMGGFAVANYVSILERPKWRRPRARVSGARAPGALLQ